MRWMNPDRLISSDRISSSASSPGARIDIKTRHASFVSDVSTRVIVTSVSFEKSISRRIIFESSSLSCSLSFSNRFTDIVDVREFEHEFSLFANETIREICGHV